MIDTIKCDNIVALVRMMFGFPSVEKLRDAFFVRAAEALGHDSHASIVEIVCHRKSRTTIGPPTKIPNAGLRQSRRPREKCHT